ncbi:CidA/LrgA family protein [uncultured Cohaesibacter sp.]|uniref:CidA/LrgA family protein n=1 Tax=uncultured Cohaesibacter sp. TaxID=1002546 RepID=UPI0029C759D5|nr:CidA/LrgA family protein [uncultured Cohaesibacter sp.]
MLFHLCVILLCQLAGESLVVLLSLPIPGPVVGMALLFVGLVFHGTVPHGLSKVTDALLSNMSLLFVPVGSGILVHVALLKREIVPIAVALVISTLVAIAVTGVLMQWLSRKHVDEKSEEQV